MSEMERDDAVFVSELFKALPTTPVPSTLEARILADFDRIASDRKPSRLAAWAQGWADRLWPGAPLWQPASLLAFSLVVGLTAGAFVPSLNASTVSTADQSLVASDSATAVDVYKDL